VAVSLYRRGDVWYYDFWFEGRRHAGSTRQVTKTEAEQVERDAKRTLRRQLAGLEPPPPSGAKTLPKSDHSTILGST
jgi:hypothetical protein